MEKTRERLLEPFPPLHREDWEVRLEEECLALHQTSHLRSKTYEGIDVEPLYDASDVDTLYGVRRHAVDGPDASDSPAGANAWEIRQDIAVQEVQAANARALYMLEKGVRAIGFDLGAWKVNGTADLYALLKDIDPEKVVLHWSGMADQSGLLNLLQQLAKEKGLDTGAFRGSILADPLGQLTLTGTFSQSFDKDMQAAAGLLMEFGDVFPDIRMVQVSANHFAGAGASAVQELGYGLSLAAEYFSWLTDHGLPAAKIAAHFQLNLGTGNHYFFEIAKVRAARILFSAFLRSYGVTDADTASIRIQSITGDWNKTVYGSHVNMLRLTTESMAAVLGGCDSLLVRPYDDCFRQSGDFSERLSRNLQIILREESYFDKVSDPAGGSYYIESITKSLCDKAWVLFLETEDRGGFVQAFRAGMIQQSVHETAAQRRQKASLGKDTLLGTNAYPDADERMAGSIDTDIAFKGIAASGRGENRPATGSAASIEPATAMTASTESAASTEPAAAMTASTASAAALTASPEKSAADKAAMPLQMHRIATAFEKIRLAVEKHPAGRPKAFMLTFGSLHMRLARSQFSCNFFASAGYEVIDNLGFEDLSKGVEEALRMKSDLIVACSSDEEYVDAVPAIHDLVNGRALLVVAGAPPSMETLKEKGIRYFIHRNTDMIDTLKTLNLKLGIKP